MVDNEFMKLPDFEKLFAAYRRNPTKDEVILWVDSFPCLYTKMVDDHN